MEDPLARAFNEGCDARLEGKGSCANPYLKADGYVYSMWRQGWRNVHDWWGQSVCGRWRYKPLPPVQVWKL